MLIFQLFICVAHHVAQQGTLDTSYVGKVKHFFRRYPYKVDDNKWFLSHRLNRFFEVHTLSFCIESYVTVSSGVV